MFHAIKEQQSKHLFALCVQSYCISSDIIHSTDIMFINVQFYLDVVTGCCKEKLKATVGQKCVWHAFKNSLHMSMFITKQTQQKSLFNSKTHFVLCIFCLRVYVCIPSGKKSHIFNMTSVDLFYIGLCMT